MSMGKLTFLGTGAGDFGSARNKACVLVESGGSILLDAGEPCSSQIQMLGLDPLDITSVFLSHGHADHISGLPMFLQNSKLLGRKDALPVHLPAFLIEPLSLWLSALSLAPSRLGFPLELHPLKPGVVVQVGGMRVGAFATSHDCESQRESFGFVVRTKEKTLGYSGDLGEAADLAPVLENGVDFLVCEMAHVNAEDLVKILADIDLEALLLVHFSASNDASSREICEWIDKSLPRTRFVFRPGDGESFPLA